MTYVEKLYNQKTGPVTSAAAMDLGSLVGRMPVPPASGCRERRASTSGGSAVAPVTQERFDQGLTYEQYKSQMTRNRDRLEANERDLKLSPDELAPFVKLRRPLKVLVIAEDWCGDVIANLPVLGRLAAESGKLDVRVFLRDQNLDLMDQYLNEGKYRSIPVFVVLGASFQEIGRFVERPKSVTEETARRRGEIFAKNPDFGDPAQPIDQLPEDVRVHLMQATAEMRAELAPFSNSEVVKAIAEIVEKAE
jgi:hypothetical protein